MNRRTFLSRTAVAAAATTIPRFVYALDSPLSEHRIERIEFRTVSIPWPRQVGRNSRGGIHGLGPTKLRVCVLLTNQGATGWGQTQGKTGKPEQLLELVKGKTVADLIDPKTIFDSVDPAVEREGIAREIDDCEGPERRELRPADRDREIRSNHLRRRSAPTGGGLSVVADAELDLVV